jgi:hypothetical protein
MLLINQHQLGPTFTFNQNKDTKWLVVSKNKHDTMDITSNSIMSKMIVLMIDTSSYDVFNMVVCYYKVNMSKCLFLTKILL